MRRNICCRGTVNENCLPSQPEVGGTGSQCNRDVQVCGPGDVDIELSQWLPGRLRCDVSEKDNGHTRVNRQEEQTTINKTLSWQTVAAPNPYVRGPCEIPSSRHHVCLSTYSIPRMPTAISHLQNWLLPSGLFRMLWMSKFAAIKPLHAKEC